MVATPGAPDARRMGSKDTAILQPGDVLEVRSAGGGGRGNPAEREPWRVARDVARGYVSVEAAERDYGVILRDGEVDEAATEAARAAMPAPSGAFFHYGPEREGYEARWTDEAYDRLTEILGSLPIHWRFFTKTEIFRRLDGTGAAAVEAAFEATCARFLELPRPQGFAEAAE